VAGACVRVLHPSRCILQVQRARLPKIGAGSDIELDEYELPDDALRATPVALCVYEALLGLTCRSMWLPFGAALSSAAALPHDVAFLALKEGRLLYDASLQAA